MRKNFFAIGCIAITALFVGAGCVTLGGSANPHSGPAGMFMSEDRGDTWHAITTLPTAQGVQQLSGVNAYRLVTDPQDPQALYWLSSGSGLFFTYNGGTTWQRPPGPLSTGFIYDIAVNPKNKCELYGSTGPQIFKSTDCGRSWTSVYLESRGDVRIVSATYNQFSPYQIFIAESNGDLLESRDGGLSWTVTYRFNEQIHQIFFDPFDNGRLYVVSRRNGIFRSTDGGQTFISTKLTFAPFAGALEYRRFFIHPTKKNVLYWVSTYGILISEDGGDAWVAMSLITPPGSAQIYSFAINPKNDKEMYYTATISGHSIFYKTADGGKNWITKKIPSGQIPTVLYVHPEKEKVLYMGFTISPN